MLLNFCDKKSVRKLFEVEGQKKYTYCLKIFNFRKNNYNLAENTKFLAWPIFNSSVDSGLLMSNVARWNRGTKGSWFLAICQFSGGIVCVQLVCCEEELVNNGFF